MSMEEGAEKIPVQFQTGHLVDQLPALVWTLAADGSIDFVNRRWCDYTGLSIEQVQGTDWAANAHPDDIPNLRENWRSIQDSGYPGELEVRLRRSDGAFRWFHLNVSPSPDANGRGINWCGLAVDIDDRKRAEKQEHDGELESRLIVDTLPGLVAVFTPSGEVESVNRQVLEYFGTTPEELKNWESGATTHPDDIHRVDTLFRNAMDSGEPFDFEVRARRADGVYRWFQSRGFPLRNSGGRIVRWYNLLIDIDDRKRAEEALAASERNLKRITDTIPGLVWSAGPDDSAEFFNLQYLEYLGLSEQEAKGSGWTIAVHPADLDGLVNAWVRILTSGQPGEAEARLRRHDGEYRSFLFRTYPFRDESGEVVKWYGINTDIEDRKQGEKMLIESEQQFRTLFEEAGAGITILDLQGVEPIRTNKAMQKMLGCTAEELGQVETFTALTAEEDREEDLALFIELRHGKRDVLRQEKHFILNDGRSVWANGTFTLLRDPAGTPRSVISIHEEITERKLALEKLQAYQDLLELAQKSAGAMAFDWYVKAEINYWSPEQEALFGLEPGTFDGTFKSWKKMMYQPDWPVVVEAIRLAEQTGEVVAEYRVIWPDGSLHWLATNGRMFFDDAGEPLRMVGFTSDVTRRKLAEEELRRSEAFLAEGQHLARTGNFSWNVTTEELMWSEQLRRIFEFEPGVPVSLELIASRVHPDDIGLMHDMVDRARRGVSDFEYEHRLLMPDDSVKHLHLIAHRTRSDTGGIEYIGAVQDVTQRRISEEALGEARSELTRTARFMSLGVLTASIAHEVNQPLSGIITNANTCVRMLDADPPNVDGARETARRTIRDGNRASEVVTRLRALFGKKEFTAESVNLNEAVQEVIALSQSDLRRTQVILQANLHRSLPLVEGDRVQLQQVILNLIRNASDAMCSVEDRPRRLLIATELDVGGVILRVKDSGTGLDPKAMNKLFDAFYTTKDEGMGIGLSVSKSIIEGHRGHLWATPNDGPGTTFSFSVPYASNGVGSGLPHQGPERAEM